MMANPVMPARIRRLVNVESGLNDGIATPFVSVALAATVPPPPPSWPWAFSSAWPRAVPVACW
jgi:sodium/hydrogen antiporter